MVLVNLGNTYAEIARLGDAERVLRQAVALAPGSKEALVSLGSVLIKLDRLAEAEAPCRAALALDPGLVAAHQNLSGILAESDPDAARFTGTPPTGGGRCSSSGRRGRSGPCWCWPPPIRQCAVADLIPRATTSVIHWYIEYATGDPDPVLAQADVVFNAIGDPDLAPETASARRAVSGWAAEGAEPSRRVALTRRCRPAAASGGYSRHRRPPVMRHEARDPVGFPGPVLMRPIGSHGGEGLRRCDDAEVGGRTAPCYVTQFIDLPPLTAGIAEYRMIFVDGRAYPYHLAISRTGWCITGPPGWSRMRHRRERNAGSSPIRPRPSVPARWQALGRSGERLGLDYAGIDFGLLADGRLVVFEANATMLVHPERDPCFAYRNPAVEAIRSAFEAMLVRCCDAG